MKKLIVTEESTASLTPQAIVQALLNESGAAKHLPTRKDFLLDYLGLRQLSFDFMNELDFISPGNDSLPNIRAALSLNDRLVAVQSGLSDKRSRFSIFHEIGHFILPEHRERLFLDNDETLSWWAKSRMEGEANRIAADLLFQQNRFTEESVDYPVSLKTILELAPKYEASYEAALRRFTERHVLQCAVIVYDKISGATENDFEDERYRLQYTITSEPFRKRFFSGLQLTEGSVSGPELYKPKYWGEVVQQELDVENNKSEKWVFATETFSNGYKIFQLLARHLNTPSST